MERHLAAILAADVVGYSRLMERDEAGAFERLRDHRKKLFEPEIAKHHGRVFKLMGDGLLAEFASVVDAVECAVALQRGMAERNGGVAEDKRIDVRIGINLGDVIIEGEDRHGEGVNIAARLQELAEPGGIAVSRTVYNHVKNKLALGFESLGEHQVKNIAEPITVFRVAIKVAPRKSKRRWLDKKNWQATAAALLLVAGAGAGWYFYGEPRSKPLPVASTPDSAVGVPVILVLPFQNLTGDSAQDNLGVGIAEDLRDLFWNFPEFQVVSGTSSIATAATPAEVKGIAHEFDAQFIIEGTVRRAGDKAVITAQLIDGATDTHLWSTRIEEVFADPVALEMAVAAKLSDRLGGMTGKLREAYERIAWSKAEADLTQYDYYVRGHTHHMRFTEEEVARARDIYAAGLKRFPDSALLHIKLAWSVFDSGPLYGNEASADLERLKTLVSKARELLAAGRKSRFEEFYLHWISAYTYQLERDFSRCITEANASIRLTPYDAFVRGEFANPLAECGRPDEAVEWVTESIRREPEGPPNMPERYLTILAWSLYLSDRCSEAIGLIETMKEKPRMTLAACQVRLGQLGAARSTMAAHVKDNAGWTVKDEAARPIVEPLLQRWLEDIRAAGLPEE